MQRVSKRLMALSESETLAMQRRSRELISKGIDVISLSIGEPDYDTPEFIKRAAEKAIEENFTHYSPVAGFADVRQAISDKFARDNKLSYTPEQVVVSTGAKQSIANVILSLIDPGEEVILPAPYWVSYIEMIKLAGGIPVILYAGIDKDYKITAQDIEEKITEKTRMLIFSSPCNPTGSVYSFDELKELATLIAKYPNLYVISDEIYEHIRYNIPHTSLASFPEVYNQVITVNGLSKGFAMTGWRLGYIGAPKWIADACDKFQGQITSGTCTISQKAAISALKADPSEIQYMVDGFAARRKLMLDLLRDIPGLKVNEPQGAFYFFPDVTFFLGKSFKNYFIHTTTDLTMYLLNEMNLATVSGVAFGCPYSIRLSYAASEEILIEAVKRLKSGLLQLQ